MNLETQVRRLAQAAAIENSKQYTDDQRKQIALTVKALRNQLDTAKADLDKILKGITSRTAKQVHQEYLEQSEIVNSVRAELREAIKIKNRAFAIIKQDGQWVHCIKYTG